MTSTVPVRREPPPFRRVSVQRAEAVSPRLLRVTLGGDELAGMPVPDPAASVRMLLPSPAQQELVVPTWNGNQFLLPDGARPAIRTLTPARLDPDALELDVEIVLHDTGVASDWARAARPGDPAAVSGPGRGYDVDGEAVAYLLAGDETAIPAIRQLLDVLPARVPVDVIVEVGAPEGRAALPDHGAAVARWVDADGAAPPGDALVAAVVATEIAPGSRIWVAGEAAAVQRIRRHLFEELRVPRKQATVRGYWKHGRGGDAVADEA